MGKESREIKKTLIGIGNLDYIEIKNVPMVHHEQYGEAVDAQVLGKIEQLVARELILKKIPIRGQEVEYFRGIFAMSQRQFAEKLGLSHVAILKWEKAKHKRLDLVNEVAVKAMMSGLLGLKLPASLDTLVGQGEFPKKMALDFNANPAKSKDAA